MTEQQSTSLTSDTSGELYFGVDARHIRQLGEQLVGDRITAVSELIKNAYDADATVVRIDFRTQPADEHDEASFMTLIVQDDGSGMRLDEMQRGWMRISTADKEANALSPVFGRRRAGRKGIGRFAAQTLGSHLSLRTSTAGDGRQLVVDFDWDEAYESGLDLDKIPNQWRFEPCEEDEHGTTLVISGLYGKWPRPDIDRVAKTVLLLQPPFGLEQLTSDSATDVIDPGFVVEFRVDGAVIPAPSIAGFLEAATAEVVGYVENSGAASIYITSPLIDADVTETLSVEADHTGPFSFRAVYFVYRKDAIGGFALREAQQLGRQFGGMRVYRDGMRVLPYGEPNNDWLGLDSEYRRRSTLVPIGTANVFGQVLLERARNPSLEDTASREGFIANDAYHEMRNVLREALLRTAVVVGEARSRKIKAKERRKRPDRRELLRELSQKAIAVLQRTPVDERTLGLFKDTLKQIEADLGPEASESDEIEQERIDALIGEIDLLRVLASLGTSMAVFSHEVRSALNAAATGLQFASSSYELAGLPRSDLAEAEASIRRLRDLSTYIDGFVGRSRERHRDPQPLFAIVKYFAERYVPTFSAGVSVEWSVEPEGLRTEPMSRAELESVLVNFFTNAVKAMDGLASDRRIRITCLAELGEIILRFEDTGRGVKESIRDRLFDAFVSSGPSDISELGVGTGLGLKIVADIAEDYGGSVDLVAATSEPYVTCFEFRVPRWKKQIRS